MSIRQGLSVPGAIDLSAAATFGADHGFDFLELDMEYPAAYHHVNTDEVRQLADEHDLDLVVHLPYRLDVASPHDHVREGACRELEAAIETAAEFGAEKGIYHAQTFARPDAWDDETLRDHLDESVGRISAAGAEHGLVACLENLKEPFFDAGDFPDLFEGTDATACLDTGHAYVSGYETTDQAKLIEEHADRISHLHLNDTRIRDTDEHLPVGLGALDFEPIVEAMVESGGEFTCTHELYTFDLEYYGHGKDAFDGYLQRARDWNGV